jgi:hypothetical protein
MRALIKAAAALALLSAAPALAEEASATSAAPEEWTPRKRYDPGLGVWVSGEARGYEGLDGAASAAGLGAGYAFDLVSLRAEYLQGLAAVAERKPMFAKLGADYAFFTLDAFSFLGRVGLTVMLNGPDRQAGTDVKPLVGPEIGFAARYRIFPKLDAFAYFTSAFVSADARRVFWNNGGGLGVAIYPFGSED